MIAATIAVWHHGYVVGCLIRWSGTIARLLRGSRTPVLGESTHHRVAVRAVGHGLRFSAGHLALLFAGTRVFPWVPGGRAGSSERPARTGRSQKPVVRTAPPFRRLAAAASVSAPGTTDGAVHIGFAVSGKADMHARRLYRATVGAVLSPSVALRDSEM